MKALMSALVAFAFTLGFALATTDPVSAHGDQPHPKCKKGYVETDDHRCVKQP